MAAKSTSDILLYAEMIAPGTLRLKDGALMTGFVVRGEDLESARPKQWASASQDVNAALRLLDTGWTLHWESVRLPQAHYIDGAFLDPTCRLIDLERSNGAEYFEQRNWVFVTKAASLSKDSGLFGKVKGWLYEHPEQDLAEELDRELAEFDAVVNAFENTLGAGFSVNRFSSTAGNDELLQALHYCVSGRWQRVRLPDCPAYLDVLLAEEWLQTDPMQLEDRLVRAISLRGYPGDSFPGCLALLQSLPFELRWSNRFIIKDYQQSEALLKKEQRRWQQKTRSLMAQLLRSQGRLDQHALERVEDLDGALADLNAGAVVYGHHSSVILLTGTSAEDLDEKASVVLRRLQQTGYVPHKETYNALEAFVGSLPGHRAQNVRRPVIHSLNLSDIVPVSTEWIGEPSCPCPFYPLRSPPLLQAHSLSGAKFYLNLHAGDVGHTLVLGPTGAGKSTLLATLGAQFFRYPTAQVFAFDKGRSLAALCAAHQSGAHVDFADQAPELCPLGGLSDPNKRAWATEWLELLLGLQGLLLEPKRRRLLMEALHTFGLSSDGGSLSDFLATIQDEAVRTALAYYVGDGPAGPLLDGTTTNLPQKNFVVFEIEELMNMGPKVINAVLLYLFFEIERRLDGRPTLLILDEAWLALSNELFSDKIREWLKVLRKANCAVVMATQSLSDIVNSPIRDAILESCPTRILLPNPEAQSATMKRLYGDYLRLDETQIDLIASAQPKRHYYYCAPGGRRLFELGLGPVQLSFVGAGSKTDLAAIDALRTEHGPSWPPAWLRHRGLDEAAERWMRLGDFEQERPHDIITAPYPAQKPTPPPDRAVDLGARTRVYTYI